MADQMGWGGFSALASVTDEIGSEVSKFKEASLSGKGGLIQKWMDRATLIEAEINGEPFGISVTSFEFVRTRIMNTQTPVSLEGLSQTLYITDLQDVPVKINLEGAIIPAEQKRRSSLITSSGFRQSGGNLFRSVPATTSLLENALPSEASRQLQRGFGAVSQIGTQAEGMVEYGTRASRTIASMFSADDTPNATLRQINKMITSNAKGDIIKINLYHEAFGTLKNLVATEFRASKDETGVVSVYLTLEELVNRKSSTRIINADSGTGTGTTGTTGSVGHNVE